MTSPVGAIRERFMILTLIVELLGSNLKAALSYLSNDDFVVSLNDIDVVELLTFHNVTLL